MRTKWSVTLIGLAMVVGVGACGGDDISTFVKLDSAKAAAFAAGGDACEAKANSVREWRTKHNANYEAVLKRLREAYSQGPPANVKEKHDEIRKAVVAATIACRDNEAFGRAPDETR